jgi:hypothetical protein
MGLAPAPDVAARHCTGSDGTGVIQVSLGSIGASAVF